MMLLFVQYFCNPGFFCPNSLIVMAPQCEAQVKTTSLSKYHLNGLYESLCACVWATREGADLHAGQGWFVLSAKANI